MDGLIAVKIQSNKRGNALARGLTIFLLRRIDENLDLNGPLRIESFGLG